MTEEINQQIAYNILKVGDVWLQSPAESMDSLKVVMFDLLKNDHVQKYLEMFKLNLIKKNITYD